MTWFLRTDVNLSTNEEETAMIYKDGAGNEFLLPTKATEELASILSSIPGTGPEPDALRPLPPIPQPVAPQPAIPQPRPSMEPLELEDTPVPSGFTPAQNLTTPLPVEPEDTGTGAWRIANPEDK